MRRRRYLAALELAGATGLAGCAGSRDSSAGTPTRSPTTEPVQVGDVTLPIDGSETVTAIHADGNRVGGLPVVVALAPGGSLVAYERRVEGETRRFESGDDRHLRAGGSRWERTTGRAVDGPYEGQRLSRTASGSTMLWSAWRAFHPATEVYGG